jgi:hypothetical protein
MQLGLGGVVVILFFLLWWLLRGQKAERASLIDVMKADVEVKTEMKFYIQEVATTLKDVRTDQLKGAGP